MCYLYDPQRVNHDKLVGYSCEYPWVRQVGIEVVVKVVEVRGGKERCVLFVIRPKFQCRS